MNNLSSPWNSGTTPSHFGEVPRTGDNPLRTLVAVLASYSILGGTIVLSGWFTLTPRLTDWLGSGIHMFPNTAVGAICVGMALLVRLSDRPAARLLCGFFGGIAGILGAVTLMEHLTGWDFGIDPLLITTRSWGFRAAAAPGRMGIPACVSFSLLGITTLLLAKNKISGLIPACGIAVTSLGSLGLIGYLFNANPLFSIAPLTGVSLPTASILLATGIAVLASVPEREPVRTLLGKNAAGILARWTLPFIVLLPIALGALFVLGRNRNWFDRGMGTALLVLSLIGLLFLLLWWCVGAVSAYEKLSQTREARFRSYFELGAVGLVVSSPEKGLIDANGEFCRMLGFTRQEILRISWPELTHPDDLAADIFQFNRVVSGEIDGYSMEKRFFRKDNSLIHTLMSVRGVRRPDGTIDHFVAVVQDVSNRKQSEEAKGRLAAIVEHSDDPIISKDLNGVITSWNRSAERVFGYTAAEVVGKPILILIPEERRSEESLILERIRKGMPILHFETVRRRKDGSLLDVSLTISPVRNEQGQIIGVSKIARDITEQKRAAQQQLALYELVATINRSAELPEIFDAAIEAVCRCHNAPRAAILLKETDGVMRFKAARNLSTEYQRAVEGHSPWASSDPTPEPVCLDDIVSADISGEVRAAMLREGIRSAAFIPLKQEKQLLGKFMIYFDTPQRLQPGDLRPALTIATQVVFAIERRKSGEALERLVNERTASLREAITQMEEFSYTVSHDLRAPLRGMKVYSETLLEDYSQPLPDEARRYLERISVNAERLDKMILDVLTFTRIARVEFQLSRVAVDRLVRQIVEQYPGMQKPNATIKVEKIPDVLGHEPSLTQALSNLLNNAIKFVPPNVHPEVRIWSERNNGHVRLWVEDNGIGIDPRYQQRLFGMFERVHPHMPYEGTGVGLAIVRKAVERMGGKVGVESDGKHGSKFWIELKATDPS